MDTQRLKLILRGAVQGVGFRPFVYRLATELQLLGWVNNSAQGVFIEVEGPRADLEAFLLRVEREKPPRSFIQSLESSFLDLVGYSNFEIRHSEETGAKTVLILPDLATCPDCLSDISDPQNRRFRYPFTNCTNCGPRFCIIEALPYDRPNTSMRHFPMCESCRAEYENPLERRFHAQPNACPQCGPHIELWDENGTPIAKRDDALRQAAAAIRAGKIVAVKGLGGFHLMVDARSEDAVTRLRQCKHREAKPLAVMCPNIEAARDLCEISPLEERLLLSAEAPIVLLHKKPEYRIQKTEVDGLESPTPPGQRAPAQPLTPNVAPGNPYLGVMLPSAPLHHILLGNLGFPVVATSGNLSDEPICTDENEAVTRLRGIADLFLVHNRPIVRHIDDSIACIALGREMLLRRARGYAPLPVHLKSPVPSPILAVGAHLKNSVALAVGQEVFVSQHIGDLETAASLSAFGRVIADFERLYEAPPQSVVCDAHPDYLSTRHAKNLAQKQQLPLCEVQHHVAHVFSCMAENELDGPLLGVAWDGTGYGLDGTIWGGEFFVSAECGVRSAESLGRGVDNFALRTPHSALQMRFAHFRTFGLPGGEKAVREPRRVALGLLYEIFGDELFSRDDLGPLCEFSASELTVLHSMLTKGINAPRTSSAGRIFDAISSLIGLRQMAHFEGQAAMELEFAAHSIVTAENYEFSLKADAAPLQIDWEPMVRAIIADVQRGVPNGEIAVRFHNTLAEIIVAVAQRAAQERVVLSGGCFQNRTLLTHSVNRLRAAGFRPYWHQRVPPNDGGIALGQIFAATQQKS